MKRTIGHALLTAPGPGLAARCQRTMPLSRPPSTDSSRRRPFFTTLRALQDDSVCPDATRAPIAPALLAGYGNTLPDHLYDDVDASGSPPSLAAGFWVGLGREEREGEGGIDSTIDETLDGTEPQEGKADRMPNKGGREATSDGHVLAR
ncbi:MAG: hypothetical protein FE78DRAFT_72861 [Acidomyces sp. 'richmondensis']|nr:MAG: hypothetical protein FE78DRAFT_72861 [Acidomyces sp. 'richmondensis']